MFGKLCAFATTDLFNMIDEVDSEAIKFSKGDLEKIQAQFSILLEEHFLDPVYDVNSKLSFDDWA